MVDVVVGRDVEELFSGHSESVRIFNQSGQLLGVMEPSQRPDYSKLTVPFTEEEIQRARQKPGRPITELLSKIRAARDVE